MAELKRTIVLVGMMGAGKSAVGSALARRLRVRLLDSDAEIEKAANMTVAEIFARDGEAFFREKEHQVIARLLAGPSSVLAVGGGAFLSERNRQLISARGVSVWLRVAVDLLWQRVRSKTTRPLLQTADPRGTLERLNAARAADYARADIVVDARPGLSAAQTAVLVEEALAQREGVLASRA